MTQSHDKLFKRRREDFWCEQCGAQVAGDGYTNHCPQCLWSKHVDVRPGDRAAECGGLMEPVALVKERLTHRCVRCGYEKNNKTAADDDFDALLRLANRIADGR
ncbi:MAG: hypothetical protein A3E38_01165 [Candidatus Moranbacteria bacterium RIFCSPHIGHO2_12_FULL_54_9]|nr:MAG: hypothetical protein A2878_03510 [Candidatus Moranbacteria bacterium RIFCSPHIGHO2_01_FULL_54_31]OGI24814.1 MAG: hypothetical protein A3E38_01165 [Candidatus Moranbacteria bacterium RIFCSPHIGHO2_12_FULL_54_9]